MYSEFATVIIWSILVTNVFPILPFHEGYESLWSNIWYQNICLKNEYTTSFLVGIIFAKYKIFENWKIGFADRKVWEHVLGAGFVIALVIYVRMFFVDKLFEIVLIPIFVFACHIVIEEFSYLKKLLGLLGKHSTNMWLVHSFYCYYFGTVSKFIYASNHAVIALLILIILSLGTSILLDLFWKTVQNGYYFLSRRKQIAELK